MSCIHTHCVHFTSSLLTPNSLLSPFQVDTMLLQKGFSYSFQQQGWPIIRSWMFASIISNHVASSYRSLEYRTPRLITSMSVDFLISRKRLF